MSFRDYLRRKLGKHRIPFYAATGGAGGTSTVVSDTFDRPDENPSFGTATSGQTWANIGTAAYSVQSNLGAGWSAGGLLDGTYIESGKSAITMQWTHTFASGSGLVGAIVRGVDLTNYLVFWWNTATNIRLSKVVAGVPTELATSGVVTAPVTGDVVVVTATAAHLITYKRNGVTLLSHTDATHATGTKHGIGGGGLADRYNNFTIVG